MAASSTNKKKRRKKESLEHKARRIGVALAVFFAVLAADELGLLASLFGTTGAVYASFALFLVPYAIAGHDVLQKAWGNIRHGKVFDENFLMTVATIGAFAMVLFPQTEPHMAEGAAVMLFYQVGEIFQAYAVGKSRKSIAAMMDIAPDFANVERDGGLAQVGPDEVAVGDVIVVKPGERVPIDGVILEGATQLDTAALTGESVPRHAEAGDEVISGCINMTGVLRVRTTKPFGESTVSRILELVENASEKKARTENFITRFARVYTPAVTGAAVLLSAAPRRLVSWSRGPTTWRPSPRWTPWSSTRPAPSPTAPSTWLPSTRQTGSRTTSCWSWPRTPSPSATTPSRRPSAARTEPRSTSPA